MEIYILLLSLLGLVIAVVWVYSFISIIRNDFKKSINKIIWLIVLIFVPVSCVLYPFIGKKQLKAQYDK